MDLELRVHAYRRRRYNFSQAYSSQKLSVSRKKQKKSVEKIH